MPKAKKAGSSDVSHKHTMMLGFLCVATESAASLERKVAILDRFELSDGDIATICGSATQSVRNARQAYRKTSHARKKK